MPAADCWCVRLARPGECDQVARVVGAALPDRWSQESIARIQASRQGRVWVALDRMEAVAGALLEQRVVDETHILLLGVSPVLQRRGIGAALLRAALTDAHQSGVRFVHLEVRASNLGALGFYNRFGFVRVGRRTRYYSSGDDALLLWLPLEPTPAAGQVGAVR